MSNFILALFQEISRNSSEWLLVSFFYAWTEVFTYTKGSYGQRRTEKVVCSRDTQSEAHDWQDQHCLGASLNSSPGLLTLEHWRQDHKSASYFCDSGAYKRLRGSVLVYSLSFLPDFKSCLINPTGSLRVMNFKFKYQIRLTVLLFYRDHGTNLTFCSVSDSY